MYLPWKVKLDLLSIEFAGLSEHESRRLNKELKQSVIMECSVFAKGLVHEDGSMHKHPTPPPTPRDSTKRVGRRNSAGWLELGV